MIGSLENFQKTEHIKKCQFLLEAIRIQDSKNLLLRIDFKLHKFEPLKNIIESKNEWFCVSQSLKHLDEIDDTDEDRDGGHDYIGLPEFPVFGFKFFIL